MPKFGKGLWACASLCMVALSVATPTVQAGDFSMFAGGANVQMQMNSMADRKYLTIVRQQYDFSCGSAAIATLLSHHYGMKTSETDAFKAMWDVGDQLRIREFGFSLLEMKNYLETIDLKADGFQLTLDRVQEIGVPGIALIEEDGYRHFVVIKGITKKSVMVGDPSKGIVTRSRAEFEEVWDGVILFIRSDVARGKENFNSIRDWRLAPAGPRDRPQDLEPLQSVSLSQTRPLVSGFVVRSGGGAP